MLVSLKEFIHNWTGEQLSRNAIKKIDEEQIETLIEHPLNQNSVRKLHDVIMVIDDKIMEIVCAICSVGRTTVPLIFGTIWAKGLEEDSPGLDPNGCLKRV